MPLTSNGVHITRQFDQCDLRGSQDAKLGTPGTSSAAQVDPGFFSDPGQSRTESVGESRQKAEGKDLATVSVSGKLEVKPIDR
jgi:hypothetical protein